MISPEFCKNEYSKADASYYLKTYGHLMQWKAEGDANILEVGCADGTITAGVLVPFCGNKVKSVLAIDISQEMVERAIIQNPNSKVTYLKMDIATKYLKPYLIGKFDHIFSFDCFQLIADQSQGADNLFKMLKPGGQVLISVLLQSELLDALVIMSETEKWSKYTRFQDNFSIYHKLKQPINEFNRIFRQAGFTINSSDYSNRTTSIAVDEFKDYAKTVNLIMQDIPLDEQEDYNKEYEETVEALSRKDDEYELKHIYIVAVLTKPFN